MGGFAEYSSYDGLGLAALVRRGEVTPRELVDAAFGAIERVNPKINAVITLLHDLVEQTLRCELPDGPFRGVPFLAKDLTISYAGIPTAAGSRLYEGYARKWDSELVRRFKKSGVVTIGKTNTPEHGMNASTEPVLHGPTRNPWNLALTVGGSSGGSAAAVVAGITPIAHANDAGGSIRIPAACAGIVGLKPSRGRNPAGPDASELCAGLAVDHIVSRTVRDTAAMLDCTSGPDSGATYWAPPSSNSYLSDVGRSPGRMLIACTFDTPSGDPVHADCKRAVIETAKLLEDLGHYVEWAAPRYDAAAYAAAFMAVIVASVATEIEDVARLLDREPGPDNLEKVNLWVLNESRRQTGMDLMRAQNVINQITRQVAGFFETCDILITPALGTLPPPIGHMFADIPDTDIVWSRVHELAPFSGLYNGTGQPAMSLPALWNDQGLPVCVQLVGRYGDENSIIRLASQLETARPWSKRKPVVHA